MSEASKGTVKLREVQTVDSILKVIKMLSIIGNLFLIKESTELSTKALLSELASYAGSLLKSAKT
jgi:hypothetical protein